MKSGSRIDQRNLIHEWEEKMISLNKTYKFIWNASDFRNTSFKEYDHVLALLSYDHLAYEIDRNPDEEPSLTEMTKKAIEMLEKNKNGYFLLVEGGRIDHGHHESTCFDDQFKQNALFFPFYVINFVLNRQST